MAKYVHPVLRPVASVCFTTYALVDEIDHHPKYDYVMDGASKLTGGMITELQRMNKQYNNMALNAGKDAELPDFLSYALNGVPRLIKHLKDTGYVIIPTVAYKEAYRSLKVHEYKNITCIELGVISSTFNESSFEWSVFLCVKNSYLEQLDLPKKDYSSLNLNPEKADVEHFRPLVSKLAPIYNELTVPLLLYLFRYYRAIKTTNDSPIKFELPEGLEFLGGLCTKHNHKNEIMTNFLQKMLEILANEDILH